ncbi:hypothetical protein ACFVTX_17695 [Agromyces sp. NPDC058136]|uniref:hypothetical protein n=1 Tax=Agromyces sp. NPDC058136 TaxID=3346354 RepID=UPI0036DE07D7
MNSEQRPPTERDAQLRQLLVATATASTSDSPKRSRTLVGSIIAFGLAGALTGGAISAAALNTPPDSEPISISVDDMTEMVVRGDTQLFGTPYIIRSSGDTNIGLGNAPAGATSIALALHCLDPGTFEYTLDDLSIGSTTCTERDTQYTNGGGFIDISSEGEHTLRIAGDPRQSYVIWASWAAPATKPEPSQAQLEALGDGTVTETEYRDGYARYSACMRDAGYPLVFVDEGGPIIRYSNISEAVDSGEEEGCYASEFEQLDIDWQIQQENLPK